MSHVLSLAGRVQGRPRTLCQKAGNGEFLICLSILLNQFLSLSLTSGILTFSQITSQLLSKTSLNLFVWGCLTMKFRLCFLVRISQKSWWIFLIVSSHVVQDCNLLHYRWHYFWSFDKNAIFQVSPWQSYSFVISKTFMRRYFETENIPFLIKFSPTGFSVH